MITEDFNIDINMSVFFRLSCIQSSNQYHFLTISVYYVLIFMMKADVKLGIDLHVNISVCRVILFVSCLRAKHEMRTYVLIQIKGFATRETVTVCNCCLESSRIAPAYRCGFEMSERIEIGYLE